MFGCRNTLIFSYNTYTKNYEFFFMDAFLLHPFELFWGFFFPCNLDSKPIVSTDEVEARFSNKSFKGLCEAIELYLELRGIRVEIHEGKWTITEGYIEISFEASVCWMRLEDKIHCENHCLYSGSKPFADSISKILNDIENKMSLEVSPDIKMLAKKVAEQAKERGCMYMTIALMF